MTRRWLGVLFAACCAAALLGCAARSDRPLARLADPTPLMALVAEDAREPGGLSFARRDSPGRSKPAPVRSPEPMAQGRERGAASSPQAVPSATTSTHLVTLRSGRRAHVNELSHATVTILEGRARIRVNETIGLHGEGEIVEIPVGAVRWAESARLEPCRVRVVFRPPFDPSSVRPVAED